MRIAQDWRLRVQRYKLVGEVCEECGSKLFPPRDVCPTCHEPARTPFAFSGLGEVYSFTTLYETPASFRQYAPYTVALVKLEEGPILTAQLTDVEDNEVHIGMPVEMVTRKVVADGDEGLIQYGYKFRPRLLASQGIPA